jgi:hypothetical protein
VGFAAGKKQQLVLVVTTAVRPGAILDSVKASRSSKEKPMAAAQRPPKSTPPWPPATGPTWTTTMSLVEHEGPV